MSIPFIILMLLVLVVISVLLFYSNQKSEISWGLTFSEKESMRLLGEWEEPYRVILDELKPSKMRLVAYWDFVEKVPGHYDFSILDRMMKMAEDRNIPVILAIGQKTPRWPECHVPLWAENNPEKEKYLLEYLEVLAKRYKNSPNLLYWQVENEPFLGQEKCSPSSEAFFKKEIDLVKALDSQHPILLADSGELSDWQKTAKYADVFGFTLYHKVYDERWGTFKVDRNQKYFLRKAKAIEAGKSIEIICTEIGMEPWGKYTNERLGNEQFELFTVEDLKYNLNFAKKMSPKINEFYLWGAEWWYFAKKHGHPEYWEAIKELT